MMNSYKAAISVKVLNTERQHVNNVFKVPITIHGFDSVMFRDTLWPVYRDVENGFNYIVVPTEICNIRRGRKL